jgi:hypothetical protein
MADMDLVRRMIDAEVGLATLSVARSDGTVQSTLVNAGLVDHPVRGTRFVGTVVRSDAVKLGLLRDRRQATVSWRDGWQWVTVEGPVELIGPVDPYEGFDPEGLPALLRSVFQGCGGTHDDWDEFDRVMAAERRTAVLVEPVRVYSNRR